MEPALSSLSDELWERLLEEWGREPEGVLSHCQLDGTRLRTTGEARSGRRFWRSRAIAEARRWGEPVLCPTPEDTVFFALPLHENNRCECALVVEDLPLDPPREAASENPAQRLQKALDTLWSFGRRENLTNEALLRETRRAADLERQKAEAIHEVKRADVPPVGDVYLKLEPDLIRYIQTGNLPAARGALNQILTHIHGVSHDNFAVLKGYLLELISSMHRAALTSGAPPKEIGRIHAAGLQRVFRLEDEEDLATWTHEMLNALLEAIERSAARQGKADVVDKAMALIRDNPERPPTREEAARKLRCSPGHLSRVFRRRQGQGYAQASLAYRLDLAADLLRHADLSLKEIARRCGFFDPSHFGKSFRQRFGRTPRQYRAENITKLPE
ncbi:MAG: helix-turn-helix domain-containing protein [Verrucomicrobia bacterium]|jgi:AraC-like DNA-binding protein|nr:helix-turn-helix domain-containing protein [Verrucomicrobiota bacterium]